MRCIADMVNLLADMVWRVWMNQLKRWEIVQGTLENNPQRLEKKYMKYARQVGIESKTLCLDVPTMWNNIYLMIEFTRIYESVFEKHDEKDSFFKNDLNNNIPYLYDWIMMKFSQCLGHFYMLTFHIFCSLYVISNIKF